MGMASALSRRPPTVWIGGSPLRSMDVGHSGCGATEAGGWLASVLVDSAWTAGPILCVVQVANGGGDKSASMVAVAVEDPYGALSLGLASYLGLQHGLMSWIPWWPFCLLGRMTAGPFGFSAQNGFVPGFCLYSAGTPPLFKVGWGDVINDRVRHSGTRFCVKVSSGAGHSRR